MGTQGRDKAAIINSFKLACLNYKPGKILLDVGETLTPSQVTLLQKNRVKDLTDALYNQGEFQLFLDDQMRMLEAITPIKEVHLTSPRFLQSNITKNF